MQPKIKAIVYSSNTGFTARYAALLAEASHLPAYDLKDCSSLPGGTPVFYMGWLMAGQIKDLKKAKKRFALVGVCGVGMAKPGDIPPEELQKNNKTGSIPTYYLQGGYAPAKLKGFYKLMMSMVAKAMARKAAENSETRVMAEGILHGMDCVSADHLSEILAWIQKG